MILEKNTLHVLDQLSTNEIVHQVMLLLLFQLSLIEYALKVIIKLLFHYPPKLFYHVTLKETLDVKEDLYLLL